MMSRSNCLKQFSDVKTVWNLGLINDLPVVTVVICFSTHKYGVGPFVKYDFSKGGNTSAMFFFSMPMLWRRFVDQREGPICKLCRSRATFFQMRPEAAHNLRNNIQISQNVAQNPFQIHPKSSQDFPKIDPKGVLESILDPCLKKTSFRTPKVI